MPQGEKQKKKKTFRHKKVVKKKKKYKLFFSVIEENKPFCQKNTFGGGQGSNPHHSSDP